MYEYENFRRVIYTSEQHGRLCFVPVCPHCGRFVKADSSVSVNGLGELSKEPNGNCSKCGHVNMPFEGYVSEED